MSTLIDNPPYRWRTVRVFISSTFRDMHAERDYLVRYVFPDLRDWCERYRIHLVDIDLRWGVTAAEAESGKVLEICLEEIDGCRPFFLGLLGSRYGWVPGRGEVPDHVAQHYKGLPDRLDRSITHLEIDHGVLSPMRESIGTADHAYFYFRADGSLPLPGSVRGWTAVERRRYSDTFFESDPSALDRLCYLKDAVHRFFADRGQIDEHLFTYHPIFDPEAANAEDPQLKGRLRPSSLRELGDRIKADLKRALEDEFAARMVALERQKGPETAETELDYHEAFAEARTRHFIGRSAVLARLREFVSSPSPGSFAVIGSPGSGKSAILAALYRELQGKARQERMQVIAHFVGASPRSTSLPSLLRRLCDEIKAEITSEQKIEFQIPDQADRLPDALGRLLASTRKRTVVILDGLNQLDEESADPSLSWLPAEVPSNVRIIASCHDGELRQALQGRCCACLDVPPLDAGERREIIGSLPSTFAKTLEERYILALMSKPETSNPLYLKVALEELRVSGAFERLADQINEMPSDLPSMFTHVLQRLERDAWDCPGLVERLFSLLACSLHGLTARELTELMQDYDPDLRHRVVLRAVRDYLQPRGELIDFFHQSFAKAVRAKYLTDGGRRWHAILADYFARQELRYEGGPWNVRKLLEQPAQECLSGNVDHLDRTLFNLDFVDAKCQAGLRYQLVGDYRRVEENAPALEAERAAEGKRRELLRDYGVKLIQYAQHSQSDTAPVPPTLAPLDAARDELDSARNVRAWLRFVGDHVARLAGEQSTLQIAFNSAARGPVAEAAEASLRSQAMPWVRLITRPEPLARPAFAKYLQRQTTEDRDDSFDRVALSADGRIAIAGDGRTTVWDVEAYRCLRVIREGKPFALQADGRRAIFASGKGVLRLIAIETGDCLREVSIGNQIYNTEDRLAATPDCRLALVLAGSSTAAVAQLWNMETGKQLCEFGKPGSLSGGMALSADGSTALIRSSGVCGVQVWDLASCRQRCLLETRSGRPIISYDANQALCLATGVSSSGLKIWDLKNGTLLREIQEEGLISCVSATPDLRRIVGASTKGRICVWDGSTGECVRRFEDPAGACYNDVALLPDGSAAVGAVRREDRLRWIDLAGETGPPVVSAEWLEWRPAQRRPSLVLMRQMQIAEVASDAGVVDRVLGQESEEPSLDSGGLVIADKLAVSANGREIACWNLETGQLEGRIQPSIEDDGEQGTWGFPLAVTPDGSRVVFGNYVNWRNRQQIGRTFLMDWEPRSALPAKACKGDIGFCQTLQLSPSGNRAVTADDDGNVALWDLTETRLLRTVAAHVRCRAVVVSPDGMLAASLANSADNECDRWIKIWDLGSGALLHTLEGHFLRTDAAFFSPDGQTLWSEGIDAGRHLIRWSVRDGTRTGDLDFGSFCALSPDGRILVCGERDTIRLSVSGSGETVAAYRTTGEQIALVRVMLPWIAYLGLRGRLGILHVENLQLDPAIVTAVRRWLFAARAGHGKWEDTPTFACPLCGERRPTPDAVLDATQAIQKVARVRTDASPCRQLPEEAWRDPHLLSECPACNRPLRFNPFIAGGRG